MGDKPELRLRRARLALQGAEEREGIRSYERRSLPMESIRAGVFETGTEPAQVVAAMKTVFKNDMWLAATGVANLGWEAAQHVGLDLRRVVRITCAGPQVAPALSTLLEGFEILVIGDLPLAVPQQRILAARATMLERIILTTHGWPFISSLLSTETGTVAVPQWEVG